MAMFCYQDLLACLQSLESIPKNILWSQEGLCFGDVWLMPVRQTLKMQCLGLMDFEVPIDQNTFQPPGTPASSMSHTTGLLLVFHADADLKDINIGLVVCHQGCNFYEQDAIHRYMGSIRADLVAMKRKYGAVGCKLPAWSYSLLVGNFGGRIVVPTNPPYCLVYANTYLSTVLLMEWTPFNTTGSPRACTWANACAAPCFRLLTSAWRESSSMLAAI